MTDLAVEPSWVCVGCRSRAPMTADVCPGCGRRFGEGLSVDRGRGSARRSTWLLVLRELIVVNLLFIVWRVVGRVSLFHAEGALSRGRGIWHLERVLHLPSEAAVQHTVLAHATISRICNDYYAWAHAASLVLTLGWLLWRHSDAYARWRNAVVVVTAVSLVVGLLPVAPPRLVPGLGMVDLAARYHQSVYGSLGHGITDQLSAMPSVHVAWALLVAVAVITASRSRWRWLVLLHPILTGYVVVATANHYWLDGVAGAAVVGLVLAARAALGWYRDLDVIAAAP